MGVIENLRNRVRWTYRRADYVARTEGLGTLARRTSAMLGLARRAEVPAQRARQPVPGPVAAHGWPPSVMVLGGRALPEGRFTGVDIPVLRPAAEDLAAQQLVSVLYVGGRADWPGPSVLAEARRLAQPLVLELLADDPVDDLPACDAVVLAAARAISTDRPVHVIAPDDGPALAQLLRAVAA